MGPDPCDDCPVIEAELPTGSCDCRLVQLDFRPILRTQNTFAAAAALYV